MPDEQKLDDFAWFDGLDALELVGEMLIGGKIDEKQSILLSKWVTDGYFEVPGLISGARIGRLSADIADLWHMEEPYEGLQLSDLTIWNAHWYGLESESGDHRITTSHSDVLGLPEAVRESVRSSSHWRIGDLHCHLPSASSIFHDERMRSLCSMILGVPAHPEYSLTFQRGSEQRLHQDMAVFHVLPVNHLIGVWVALEDISPDSGPLVYYPGSHREGMYPSFSNYPQTNRRTTDDTASAQYDRHIVQTSRKYEERHFLAKAGDALFWHGQLIHGGSGMENPDSTRRSFIVHFMSEGADRSGDVTGPVNW